MQNNSDTQNSPEAILADSAALLAALPDLLLPWYNANKRDLPWRRTRDPYRILVSEIMLQQTRVGAVIGYYERFLCAYPTVQALAQADEKELLKLWEGLGYYSRARNLQKAAKTVCEKFDGIFPQSAEQLRTLPGVGDYTAGAVASIAFEKPTAAIDGNVLRIMGRVLAYPSPATPDYKKALGAALEKTYPAGQCGDFTQSFMDLGSAVCLPKTPQCALCPLQTICRAFQKNQTDLYPVRTPKQTRTQENRTVFVLRSGNAVAMQKRSDTGLLASLWELPNVSGHLFEQEAFAAVDRMGGRVCGAFTVRRTKHVFTHIEWHMLIYDMQVQWLCAPPVSADPNAPDAPPLPTAFKKCL